MRSKSWLWTAVGSVGLLAACGADSEYVGSGKDAGASGSSGAGGSAGFSGGPTGAPLGSECVEHADCQTGFCLPPSASEFLKGGPAHGYCTLECTEYANAQNMFDPCGDFGDDSMCVVTEGSNAFAKKAYCLKGCVRGPAMDWQKKPLDTLNSTKCDGRRDVACLRLVDQYGNPNGTPVCMPHCIKDADCANVGRKCDPLAKVCRDENDLTQGRGTGASCSDYSIERTIDSDPCAGICITLIKDNSYPASDNKNRAPVCSDSCIVNTFDSCGFDLSFPSTSAGACLVTPEGAGAGDLGFCRQMCDIDQDCLAYGDKYANVSCNIELAATLGRGFCDYRYGHWEGGAGGAAGASGSAGAAGASGSAGATGASGSAGAAGATGASGSAGAAGASGSAGATGASGAAGSAS